MRVRNGRQLLRLGLAAIVLSCGAPMPYAQMQPPPVPSAGKHIYPETSKGPADVKAAIQQAKQQHKRVLLIFGGDWCPDCQVLDINLHDPANAQLIAQHYIVTHVNIGHQDANIDLAKRYGVPVSVGVPAISVVDGQGKLIYAQGTGEFRSMRHMDPRSVNQFLNQWKA